MRNFFHNIQAGSNNSNIADYVKYRNGVKVGVRTMMWNTDINPENTEKKM